MCVWHLTMDQGRVRMQLTAVTWPVISQPIKEARGQLAIELGTLESRDIDGQLLAMITVVGDSVWDPAIDALPSDVLTRHQENVEVCSRSRTEGILVSVFVEVSGAYHACTHMALTDVGQSTMWTQVFEQARKESLVDVCQVVEMNEGSLLEPSRVLLLASCVEGGGNGSGDGGNPSSPPGPLP